MASSTEQPHCSAVPAGGVALPVVGRPTHIRPSRMSRWRAVVLIGVHVLIAIHIAHWLATGSTFTPVEPSEAMEFSKHSIINVGVVFFALAILSTLVLGRWFCGWACHLVALQDLARWLLGKVGLRPRPLRSSILVTVPLLAFLYMFVAPLVYRALTGDAVGAFETHWRTTDFWETFPSWLPATLTLVICGFVAIYFLGAKGFCTNACPYGGVFGVADQLAPMRIRVTDACEQCGHCTAVCTSNVRVHEEVRDFGMVVDPGCMKCLDCVSVCPNNALYPGWGAPALLARPRRETGTPSRSAQRLGVAPGLRSEESRTTNSEERIQKSSEPFRNSLFAILNSQISRRWAPAAAFSFAAFTVFLGFDRAFLLEPVQWTLIGIMTLSALMLMAVFRPRSRWPRPLTVPQELVLAVSFLVSMLAFRGLHGMVAFLFALGVSAIAAYLCLQLFLLVRRRDLSMHGLRLKRQGRLLPAGYGFLVAAAGLGSFGAYAGTAQADAVANRWLLAEIEQLERAYYAQPTETAGDTLVARYREYLERQPDSLEATLALGRLLHERRAHDELVALYDRALQIHPGNAQILTNYGVLEAVRGDINAAIERLSAAVESDPDLANARKNLADLLAVESRWEESIRHLEALERLRPDDPEPPARQALARAQIGAYEQALSDLDRAEQLAGEREDVRGALANMRRFVLQLREAAAPEGP